MMKAASSTYPRILILDYVKLGSISATGQMKKNLFLDWPKSQWLQIYCQGPHDKKFSLFSENESTKNLINCGQDQILRECQLFDPSLVYYRPVSDNLDFYNFAERLIDTLKVPVVTHIVDDWPSRLLRDKPDLHSKFDISLRKLINQSAECLAISLSMSQAFKDRYGVDFVPIMNCIDPKDWASFNNARRSSFHPNQNQFTIRYAGALADDMNFSSICDIIDALKKLHKKFPFLKLEIYTWSLWKKKAIEHFKDISFVQVLDSNFSPEEYRNLLMTSDALIIAYNFDLKSINYVKHSIANKLPECMASGTPVLVYGPRDVATVSYAETTKSVYLIPQRNQEQLIHGIEKLILDPVYAYDLGEKAQDFVFSKHNSHIIRKQFYDILRKAVRQKKTSEIVNQKSKIMNFSELELIYRFPYSNSKAKILVDVGAHVGSVSKKFASKNWKVIAFEPEPDNRKDLEKNLSAFNKNVTIIPKAVSNQDGQFVSFYVSSEHWGIHSLKPFHPTHKPTMTVETVRLDKTLNDLGITDVSLLKVDVEGADFLVLQSFDFEKIKPEVVMCEFADDRSLPNFGCTHHDISRYMNSKDYKVFISEWGEIKEYGRKGKKTEPHEFLQCIAYPLNHQPAWGNLIFVRHDLTAKFEEVLYKYLMQLGTGCDKQGDKKQALKFYKNAILIKPISETYHKVGDILMNQQRLEEAEKYYDKAIELKPDSPWSYRGIGQIMEIQGQSERAIKAYRKAIELRPDYEYAKTLLSSLISQPVLLESQSKLLSFKDKHRGQRCVIIGNGPSLNKMDLSFLKNEICFGMNRIYLGFDKWGFTPTYYVTVNKLVIEQSVEQILNIPCTKFISNKGIAHLPNREDVVFVKTLPYQGPPFSTNPAEGLNEGSTVTYVAIQLAYYMGFNEVILIGVDHNFVTKGQPHKEVVSQGDDPNHFHPSYFGKGTRWHLPDLETSEKHYRIAHQKFQENSRQIIDATLNGHCNVFPKKNYKEVFKDSFYTATFSDSHKYNIDSSDDVFKKSSNYSLEDYNKYVQLAWSMYSKNEFAKMADYLKKSLDVSPYLVIETVVNWIEKFDFLALESYQEFDADQLSNSLEWEQLIEIVLSKVSES